MNVIIYDKYHNRTLANWSRGQFRNLNYTKESPGGMLTASLEVPLVFSRPYEWANIDNQIEIYHGPMLVWSGIIYALERFWDEEESGIRVDCVGWVSKLSDMCGTENLSGEKASTYITDHVQTDDELAMWIEDWEISTTDYEIPGLREYKPCKNYREILDDLLKFNESAYTWYVRDKTFYWQPLETEISYITSTKFCIGSVRQEKGEFANKILYSYRDADGAVQTGLVVDDESEYPAKYRTENYASNMSSSQAEQLANESLEIHKVFGSTATIRVSRLWDLRGAEIHPSEIEAGKIIRVEGLVPAIASVEEIYIENDIDTFRIKSITYDAETETAEISPGRIPNTIPILLARSELK